MSATPSHFGAVGGEPLGSIAAATLAEGSSRDPLYQALLAEPLCLAEVGPSAPPGPSLKLSAPPIDGTPGPSVTVRLVESTQLGAPVVALYASGAAMVEGGNERGLWPDGAPRGVVLGEGLVFPLLRGHPGALMVVSATQSVALDAGEVAALAERLTPSEYVEGLRKLCAAGRPREAARRLAGRPVYTLGHPRGGMLMFQRELPIFLHLASAERFAQRLADQTGGRMQHGLVAAAEIFKHATRGKLFVLVDPGPGVIRLRPDDMR